jgi:glycosyltransferase involved in cell wall biosynthesis
MEKISVVIPVFNAHEELDRALLSVYNQSHTVFEVIVVDDGSSLTYDNLCKSWSLKGLPLTLVRLDCNSGPGVARNIGISKATGDFIALLDADDFWHPMKLERQIDVFRENLLVNILGCRSSVFNGKFYLPPNKKIITPFSFFDFLVSCRVPTRTVMFRRNVQILFGDRCCAEDYFAWLTYLQYGNKKRIWRLEEVLAFSGRAEHSKGGYSGNLWEHEVRELRTLWMVLKNEAPYFYLLPCIIFFSFLKYLRRKLLQRLFN